MAAHIASRRGALLSMSIVTDALQRLMHFWLQ
jgi:hypothetical protein